MWNLTYFFVPAPILLEGEGYEQYVAQNKDKLRKYALLNFPNRNDENTRDFLVENYGLLDEHAEGLFELPICLPYIYFTHSHEIPLFVLGYLLLLCLDHEMKGETEQMAYVARNYLLLHYVLELAKSLRRSPREAIVPFFRKTMAGSKGLFSSYLQ